MSQCWTCSHASRRAAAPGDAVGVCRECNGLGCGGHGVVDAALGCFVCHLCVANAVAGTGRPAETGGPLGALALSPPAEIAVRYRGLVAQAREVLPRVVRVREAVAQVGELRSLLRDGRPAGLPGGDRLDWAVALGLAALSDPGEPPSGVVPPGDAGDAMVRIPAVMGLSYVMALDPDGTRGALWPWYEEVDAPWVTLADRRDTLVADVASGVLAELGVEAAEPAPAELAQALREVAGLPGPLAGLDVGEIRSHRAVILASAVRGMPLGGIPTPAS